MYEHIAAKSERGAVRLAIEATNEWMHAERWDMGDALLTMADIDRLGVTGSIGMLAALDPMRARTPAREGFIQRFADYLHKTLPDRADKLLQGVR